MCAVRQKLYKKKWRIIIGWENFLFSYFAIYTKQQNKKKQSPVGRELIHSAIACLWQCSFQTFFNLSDFCIYTKHAWLSLSLSPFYASDKSFWSACLLYMRIALIAVERERVHQIVSRSQLRLRALQIYLVNKNPMNNSWRREVLKKIFQLNYEDWCSQHCKNVYDSREGIAYSMSL